MENRDKGKKKSKCGPPNTTGKSRRPLDFKSAMGGQATISLAEQLHTAEWFFWNSKKWPRVRSGEISVSVGGSK